MIQRVLSTSERLNLNNQSFRTLHTTPVLKRFLERSDVKWIRANSGWYHLFVGDNHYEGETLLEAVEKALPLERVKE